MRIRSLPNEETGAILPITALIIVVLLVFGAFTVDLGMAWAQRRGAQSAADAGAMAGALASGDIVADAIDFVERNVGDPASLDWASCPDPDPDISSYTDEDGNALDFAVADGTRTNCVWTASANTGGRETYVAVRVPNMPVDTAFASVIGIDTIDVDAFAISRSVVAGPAKILPFAVPTSSPTHSCLGTPPAGIARNPCGGGTTGNFGYLGSPHHGDLDDLGTVSSCDGGPNDGVVLTENVALGTDHPITVDPDADDEDYPDSCAALDPPTYIPNSVDFYQGNDGMKRVQEGLISDSVFGNGFSSRLQHPQSIPDGGTAVDPTRTILDSKEGDGTMVLDNVGLWEYISPASTGVCNPTNVPAWSVGGPDATNALMTCLAASNNATASLVFTSKLLDSPRFAVIPQIYGTFPPGNSEPRAIEYFRAVYLQATWFNCNANSCVEFIDIDDTPQEIFFPGEGVADACPGNNCKDASLTGLSALLLPINASPSGVIDLGPDSDQSSFAELVR